MSEKVLNPTLYRRLEYVFGSVKVSSHGLAMVAQRERHPLTGRMYTEVLSRGEYYCVCCPRCNDTRNRLYISYRFGTQDEEGYRMLSLVVCYNEDCFRDYHNRRELYELLETPEETLKRARPKEGRVPEEGDESNLMPAGPVTRLDALPPDHPANVFLAQRGFEPELLGYAYGVGVLDNPRVPPIRGRIYIPIVMGGHLRGWQARRVDVGPSKGDDKPKWYGAPGMQKSQLLYNLDRASEYGTLVLVEGCSDVWAVGPMGVGILGSSLSPLQARRIAEVCRKQDKTIVLVLDGDEDRGTIDLKRERLTRLVRTVVCPAHIVDVVMWDGLDPGDLDRGVLRQIIEAQAREQGVKIQWA